MGSLKVIPQNEDIINTILAEIDIKNKTTDYGNYLVVFPNRRPAHFLRKRISEAIKTSFIPPLILSIDDLIDHIYPFRYKHRSIDTIDAIKILFDIQKETAKIGREHFLTLDQFLPIGIRLFNDLEELHIEKINPQTLQMKLIDDFNNNDIQNTLQNRLQPMSVFYSEFHKRLNDLGLSTRSSRYVAVSDDLNKDFFKRFKRVFFAGFYALTRSERDLFTKLDNLENVMFIYQCGEGLDTQLSKLGKNIQTEKTTTGTGI
ncbi:MAG: hypothetical protein SNJ53_04905, partial [Thermodesulfovibrionales bacterium]